MEENIKYVGLASLSYIEHYDNVHAISAAHNERISRRIEKGYKDALIIHPYWQNLSSIMACLFSSVAFLEARINKFFIDANDNVIEWNPEDYKPENVKIIKTAWSNEFVEKLNTLEKYQLALMILSCPEFNRGENPYQDTSHLILLRNALIHHKPVWISLDRKESQKEQHKFEKLFKSKNLPPNPFAVKMKRPFFPDKLLGHGLARWAIETSLKFVEDFSNRVKVPFNCDNVRQILGEE